RWRPWCLADGDGPWAPAVRDLAEVREAGQADGDGLALHEIADAELDGIGGRAVPLDLERDRHPGALSRHEDLVALAEPVGQRAARRPLPADLLESAQREHGPRRAERERLRRLVRDLNAQLKSLRGLRRARAGVLGQRWRASEQERSSRSWRGRR